MAGGSDTGPLLDRQIARHLRWARRSYLVEGGRERRAGCNAGSSLQTDGVLGSSRSCMFWCATGSMVDVAWVEPWFVVMA